MYATRWRTLLLATAFTRPAFTLPAPSSLLWNRDHLDCVPMGPCQVVSTCDNDYHVMPGSDPSTPSVPPDPRRNLFARPAASPVSSPNSQSSSLPAVGASSTSTTITQAITQSQPLSQPQTKRKRFSLPARSSPKSSPNLPSALQERQTNPRKWCALGSSLYLSLTPVADNGQLNAANMNALLRSVKDLIDDHLNTAGDGAMYNASSAQDPSPSQGQDQSSGDSQATYTGPTQGQFGQIATQSASPPPVGQGGLTPVAVPLLPTAGSPSGNDGVGPIFGLHPAGAGGDGFEVFEGTDGGITWGGLGVAVDTLSDFWAKEGAQWVEGAVVLGTSQVGRIRVY